MDKKQILDTIQEVRKNSKKRNFNQTFDLVINLKGLDLKNPEHNINNFLQMPFYKGKESKVGAVVGDELISKAKAVCDEVIHEKDLTALSKDKKKVKKLSRGIDYFLGQADIMPKIATSLGKVLGPIGKMPNPKAGCIIPPTIPDLKHIVAKLKNTVRIHTKNEPGVKVMVGKQDMKDEEIAENVLAVYNNLIHSLPQERQNIKSIFLKLTMSKSFLVGRKVKDEKVEKEQIEVKEEIKEEPKEKENGKA